MIGFIRKLTGTYKVIILIFDLLLIMLSYIIAYLVKFNGEIPTFNFTPFINAIPYILAASVIYLDMFKVLSFFRKSIYDVLKSVGSVAALLGITTIAITYMLQGFSFPRSVLLITPGIQFLLLSGFNIVLLYMRRHLLGEKSIMIICESVESSSALIDKIHSFIKRDKIEKKLILDISQEKIIFRRLKAMDEIYLSSDIPAELKAEVIKRCMGGKQVIYVVPHLVEISLINAKLMQLDDTPSLMIPTLGLTVEQNFLKRMFDIVASFLGLLLISPILIIVAALIKMTSKGPALYKQERITKGNKPFMLLKFRTMRENAEDETGPVLSEENDPRVTPIGRILRKTRIDELPQLINVLKGEMSLVGPRPERPFFVEQFIHDMPEYGHRFAVKAGITGYAQVFGNYSTSPEDKLRYDLMYIRNYSLILDIKLILQTFKVFFVPGSAYKKEYPPSVAKAESAASRHKATH
ncbi:MAG: sugar transferase [Acetivibrionales bacterium]|jgi:exopolysaccharide biosynthesis polyprenyl glycosylphosphotransferase